MVAGRPRVFRTTDVTCGKEAARTIKSVAFLAPGPAWINVQHVSGDIGHHRRARAALSPRRQPEPRRRQQGAAAERHRVGGTHRATTRRGASRT